jgi:hypothetical protein
MKLNASTVSIRPNAGNLCVLRPSAPALRGNRLDSMFHVLLLAIGFALAVDAAVQSALDTTLFAGDRSQLAAKTPSQSAYAAERAAAMAVNCDAASRVHVKS